MVIDKEFFIYRLRRPRVPKQHQLGQGQNVLTDYLDDLGHWNAHLDRRRYWGEIDMPKMMGRKGCHVCAMNPRKTLYLLVMRRKKNRTTIS
jgi:hypothetical protein